MVRPLLAALHAAIFTDGPLCRVAKRSCRKTMLVMSHLIRVLGRAGETYQGRRRVLSAVFSDWLLSPSITSFH